MWPVSPFTFLPDCSSHVPTESWVYRAQQRYWRSLRVHQIRWQHALAYHLVTDLQGTCCRTSCLSNWYELIREAVQEAWEKLGCHDLEHTDQGEGLNAILEISLTQLNPVRYKWLLFPLNFSVPVLFHHALRKEFELCGPSYLDIPFLSRFIIIQVSLGSDLGVLFSWIPITEHMVDI